MNSEIIKYVAGGGKTTYSANYLKNNKNGLYLAFTNSVVEDVSKKGFLSKTIDSLFISFIIPKLCCIIPLASNCSKVTFVENDKLPNYLKNVSQLRLDENGNIYNKSKKLDVNINTSNEFLHKMSDFPNSKAIKYIFDKNCLRLNHIFRSELCEYIIKTYPNEIIELLSDRFDFIIIDEAQDLSGYRETFANLLYNSHIKTIVLGDDFQNIINNGIWFEKLIADKYETKSHRCPETNCKWIRDNLNIEIYGNSNSSIFAIINYNEIKQYDDGEKFLLYFAQSPKNKEIIRNWSGPKDTIKSAKGKTINRDIVIIGNKMSDKNLYTAITRTTKNVYSTIKK